MRSVGDGGCLNWRWTGRRRRQRRLARLWRVAANDPLVGFGIDLWRMKSSWRFAFWGNALAIWARKFDGN